jgi:hypothetical protein
MSSFDSNPLIKSTKQKRTKRDTSAEVDEHDDFAGVIINAGKSINVREMVIVWLWFLIIHSEIFIERFLSKISGTVDINQNLTMNGTIYLSIIMIIGIIIIDMIYR